MDRIMTQVIFRKFLWICPSCKQEDVEDRDMDGGQSYEHICSECATKFNQSGSNVKQYNGCLTIPSADYATMREEDIVTEKTKKFDDWVYEIKNPPAVEEPTKAVLEQLKAEKQKELDEIQTQIDAKEIV